MAAAAKPLTKSQLIATLAEESGLQKKDVAGLLENLATLAYQNAKLGFTIPGLGKLELKQRKARMGRNPATGESIQIPAKKVVKFRVAKACKDAIIPPTK
ncbi:MAG: DNA-binding protein [Verrucomicrobiales bacterium]|nr:DNA-binding protein [Verrucomicrobiales bacterium]|tara:strand:- start:1073 stop:1372 length:300 start_codon:yes stop_codon:yes gene_type:complete